MNSADETEPTARRRIGWLAVWLVVALPLLSYPLSWLPVTITQSRFHLAVPLGELVAVAVLLTAAWARATPQRPGQLPLQILAPVGLLLVSWLLSIRFSSFPHFSIGKLPETLGCLAVFGIGLAASPSRLTRFCFGWLAAAVLVATLGLTGLGVEPEFVSTFGNRNFLAAYLAASLCLGAVLCGPYLRDGARGWPWGLRLGVAVAAGALLVGALCFCRSRGAWLALGAGGAIWFIVDGPGKRPSRTSLMLVVAVGFAWLARSYIREQWRTDVRPVIWQSTLEMFADQPVLGHGLDTFEVVYPKFRQPEYFLRPKHGNLSDHAHNELLEVAAEQGLLGLLATVWLWGVALYSGWRSFRVGNYLIAQRQCQLGLWLAALVLMMHGMLDVDLRHRPNETLLWLLLGLMLSWRTAEGRHEVARSSAAPPGFAGRDHSRGKSPAVGVLRFSGVLFCLVIAGWLAVAGVWRPVRADWWERQARLAEVRGDLARAITAAQRSLQIEPLRLETRYFLAGLWASLPGPAAQAKAIDQALRLRQLSPHYGDLTFNLANLYLAQGQPAAALPYLYESIEEDPYRPDARSRLAETLTALGQSKRPPPVSRGPGATKE